MPDLTSPAFQLLLRHLMRFGAVGLAGAALDYGILMILMHLGMGAVFARMPAIAVTLVFTWIMNRRLTFTTKSSPSWGEFCRYALAALTGILINLGVYWVALLAHAPVWFAFVVGTGTAAVYTFIHYRKLLHDA